MQDARDEGLVGSGTAMSVLRRRIARLADVPTTVLLLGETGTGKSQVARMLHARSKRSSEPFIVADCAALAPSLVESELFGSEPGAFTGAHKLRRGRAELAGRGTLLLEEVAELSPRLQAKLLRLLQERRFERLGGARALPFEARVVAATHVDLEAAVRAGRFREDLFYRLDVARITLPALRDRFEDLPELIDALGARIAQRLDRESPRFADDFVAAAAAHPWPGNVRELANAIERALVLQAGGAVLTAHHLDLRRPLRAGVTGGNPAHEAEAIVRALRDAGGNVAGAARRLGLPRTTLRRRIERLGLDPMGPRDANAPGRDFSG